MTSVFNGKIRRWYISKSEKSNVSDERYIAFTENKPTVHEQGMEWIPVISLDDFHKEVNINISRWVEVAQELCQAKEEIKKLRESNEKLKKCVEYYACEMSYSVDSYEGISGEMRSRVVLYGDSEERNDVYSYAGRRAREVLKEIEYE